MKKLLSIILTVVLLLSIVPMGALTASAYVWGGTYGIYTYDEYDGEVTITGCDESVRGALVIPSYIDGYPVTKIGDSAFYDCRGITSVTIPNTVEYIGSDAFYNCNSLTIVNIPNSVTGIGSSAFGNCYKLSTVTIPGSVTNIGDSAFYGCNNLTSASIGYGVMGIGGSAFEDCSKLKSVTIPNSVMSIGASAFSGCVSLTSVSLPNGILEIGDEAFSGCGSLKNITIPSSVIEIQASAFNGTGLTSVTIPSGVTNIGSYAFRDCSNLQNVYIAEGVVEIGGDAFYGCNNLKTVVIPKSVTKIGSYAFSYTFNITDVYYGGSQSQKSGIAIGSNYSTSFESAKWHYNTCDLYKHTYSSDCDSYCNKCDWGRVAPKAHNRVTTTTKATTAKDGGIVNKCTVCGNVASNTTIKKISSVKLSATSYTYNGGVKTPAVIVKDSAGKTLVLNTDYTVTYPAGRKNAGTYKVKVVFKGKYSGTSNLTFKINPIKSSTLTAKLSASSYTYNGKAKKPSVTVKNSAGKTVAKSNYTVTYQTGRKNVGKYKVVVKFKGNYSGTKVLYFTVKPAKTSVKKLTAGTGGINVKITKKSKQVSGYVVQYSTSKTFKSAKTKTVKSYKTTSVTLKSLKANKTYYVRVRTYKTVNGKKYYSDWSKYKYIKTPQKKINKSIASFIGKTVGDVKKAYGDDFSVSSETSSTCLNYDGDYTFDLGDYVPDFSNSHKIYSVRSSGSVPVYKGLKGNMNYKQIVAAVGKNAQIEEPEKYVNMMDDSNEYMLTFYYDKYQIFCVWSKNPNKNPPRYMRVTER